MEREAYRIEAEVEADHWWFVGRRRLFGRELRRAGLPKEARVLDIGTSTGTNLRMLRDMGFARISGVDASAAAIDFCESKGLGRVRQGDICALPFDDESFDFVLATDVIEHVEDDAGALHEVFRVLRPGGRALITVPAFPSLWGLQDDLAHHRRRYRLAPLLNKIEGAGLRPRRQFHFNFLLFFPIWLARRLIRALPTGLRSENQLNTPLLNWLLRGIFTLDVRWAPIIRLPFGVSILVLAERPGR